jgi:hypothetical protein
MVWNKSLCLLCLIVAVSLFSPRVSRGYQEPGPVSTPPIPASPTKLRGAGDTGASKGDKGDKGTVTVRKAPSDSDKEGAKGSGVPEAKNPPDKEIDYLNYSVVFALEDAMRLPPEVRPFVRYVWWPKGWEHTHLLTRTHQALLSDQGDFPNPVPVGPRWAGVYRLNFVESGWDKRFQVWERFANIDFVYHVKWRFVRDTSVTVFYPPGIYKTTDGKEKYYPPSFEIVDKKVGDEIARVAFYANPPVEIATGPPGAPRVTVLAQDELRKLLFTEVPILHAGFWLVRTSRVLDFAANDDLKVGYNEWFGIRNRNDYLNFIGLKEDVAVARFAEWRAVQQRSGISKQNRQIGVLKGAATGLTWFTLDTKKAQARGIALNNLRRDEFDKDAEEWISHKPDGLPINGLFQSKDNPLNGTKAGDSVTNAPDFIGSDTSALNPTNDKRIHHDTCWNCHGISRSYIFPFKDAVRETHEVDDKTGKPKVLLIDPSFKVKQELNSAYLRPIQDLVDDDRLQYERAIRRVTMIDPKDRTGLTVAGFTRIYRRAFYQYVDDLVTIDVMANDLGVSREQLREGLIKFNAGRGSSSTVLGQFIRDPPGEIDRTEAEDSYLLAQMIARGYRVPEVIVKVKGFGNIVIESKDGKEKILPKGKGTSDEGTKEKKPARMYKDG